MEGFSDVCVLAWENLAHYKHFNDRMYKSENERDKSQQQVERLLSLL